MEQQHTKNEETKKIVVGAAILVLLAMALVVCYLAFRPKTQQGEKTFTVEVIDNEGVSKTYTGQTDAEYLRQALEELEGFTMEGSESEYGLFVDTVNGVTADYSADGSYWAFYVNGVMCDYGVDSQPVADQDAFTIRYESASN